MCVLLTAQDTSGSFMCRLVHLGALAGDLRPAYGGTHIP